MLLKPILFDADMTAAEVLARAAANGFDPEAPPPRRDPRKYGAAIRRQWGTYVLWYARRLEDVLGLCAQASEDTPLAVVLNLHEYQSDTTTDVSETELPRGNAILFDAGMPIGVSLDDGATRSPPAFPAGSTSTTRSGTVLRSANGDADAAAPDDAGTPVMAWPRIDAPEWENAGKTFNVDVGFSLSRRADVAGGPVTLPFTQATPVLDVMVELSAGPNVKSLDGWRQVLSVSRESVDSARVRFRLVGDAPTDADRPWLTTIEVRYVLGGTVCGVASRPLSIMPAGSTGPDARPHGTSWAASPAVATPVVLAADAHAPDLTLEISKPDGNAASGRFQARLSSRYELAPELLEPFDMDLGQDARTFARQFANDVRNANDMIDFTLQSFGELVADRMPAAFFTALAEVAKRTAPEPPAVLIVTAEHYVPWELAWLDPPLDATRPNFLGAQAIVGKWIRDRGAVAGGTKPPAVHPTREIDLGRLAVMAAWYKASSGLNRLEKAEEEAQALAANHAGIAVPAKSSHLRDLLSATLSDGFKPARLQAVHFAGHGDYDPTVPDAASLFLQDGTPVNSLLFRAARFGGDHQPLLFLNACMLGVGGELLGDMAGFPGNSLRGGFGGFIGALWEVDDQDAYDFATEFWKRALPSAAANGAPVGAVLRDLRQRYAADPATPIPTFLAYAYYGHPRLTLRA